MMTAHNICHVLWQRKVGSSSKTVQIKFRSNNEHNVFSSNFAFGGLCITEQSALRLFCLFGVNEWCVKHLELCTVSIRGVNLGQLFAKETNCLIDCMPWK